MESSLCSLLGTIELGATFYINKIIESYNVGVVFHVSTASTEFFSFYSR